MDNKNDKQELSAFEYSNLMKSNLLIGAKYKASLMELRITYAALFMLQNNKYSEEPDGFYVNMYPSELKTFLGVEGHSIYEALEPVAQSMTNRSIGFSDPVSKTFDYVNLISRARYEDGVFTVKFNKDLQDYILDIKSNFTNLNKLTMMSFSSAYSFRLYELLKQQCYYPNSYHGVKNNIFSYKVGLSELKFNLGVINANLDEVRKILSSGNQPDYERAEAKSPEKISSYGNWSNFKAKCLDVAVNEINRSKETDIFVKYTPLKAGRGGKVKSIDFTIYLNGAEDSDNKINDTIEVVTESKKPEINETQRFYVQYQILESLSDYNVDIESVRKICDAAKYDKDLLFNIIDLLKQQRNDITNVTGWLITAINERYVQNTYMNTGNRTTSNNKSSTFNHFDQRSYDFKQLENSIISDTNDQ